MRETGAMERSSAPKDNLLDRVSTKERFAYYYGRFAAREKELISRRITDVIAEGRILNVGCGQNGVERSLFPVAGYPIHGVDINAEELRILRGKNLYQALYKANITSLPFRDESFDIIYLRLVLHHLVYPENILSRALEECFRVLRSGGILALVEPNSWHPVGAIMNLAHRLGLDMYIHGTDDDVALSPLHLRRIVGRYSTQVYTHAVTYSWRRLPIAFQAWIDRAQVRLNPSLDRLPYFGHTLMIVAQKR
jgi:SAM-dependent methyltransferase